MFVFPHPPLALDVTQDKACANPVGFITGTARPQLPTSFDQQTQGTWNDWGLHAGIQRRCVSFAISAHNTFSSDGESCGLASHVPSERAVQPQANNDESLVAAKLAFIGTISSVLQDDLQMQGAKEGPVAIVNHTHMHSLHSSPLAAPRNRSSGL